MLKFLRLIVQDLLGKGVTVRALVRNVYRARNLRQLQGAEVRTLMGIKLDKTCNCKVSYFEPRLISKVIEYLHRVFCSYLKQISTTTSRLRKQYLGGM